jgi:anti-anti-sigma regulatory factor
MEGGHKYFPDSSAMGSTCIKDSESITISTGAVLLFGDTGFRNFEKNLFLTAKKKVKKVIIDFSGCIYIDSRAIASIITLYQRLRIKGTQICIQNTNNDINDLLRAIQLDQIIEME